MPIINYLSFYNETLKPPSSLGCRWYLILRIRLFSKGVFFYQLYDENYFQKYLVDWSVRCETPVGVVGQVRPRRSASDEEAHRPPHGK